MKKIFLMLTLCLAMSFLAGLVIADDHASKKEDANDGWTNLIPEEGFEGWSTKDMDKYWKLEDGQIVGENENKKGSVLWTEKDYGDYELIVEYITPSEDYDGGVFLRGSSHQVQIGISRSLKKDLTACLYCPKDGNGKYPQQPHDKVKEAHKLGKWNTLRMVTQGKNIKTYLNGELINDYDGVKYPEKGKIGLQLHSGVHMKMAFKTVKVRALDEGE